MGVASYEKKAVIQVENCEYMLDREMERGKWLLMDMKTGFTRVMTFAEMQMKYAKGVLVFRNKTLETKVNASISDRHGFPAIVQPQHPDQKLEVAKVRRLYVLSVMDLPMTQVLIEQAIRKVWNRIGQPASPPHWITVIRWKKRFIQGGENVAAVVDRNGKKGRWPRYPEQVKSLVSEAIDTHFLSRPAKTIQQTLEAAIMATKKENSLRPASFQLPEPTRRLVKRMINEVPAIEKYAAHYGGITAANKFRATLYRHVTDSPLQRVEMDHTQLDLFVLRDKDFVPLGRPYVTTCIDAHTRCILGIWIGFEPPSYLTASRCLKHAILPKVDLQEIYPEIKNTWNAHGIPVMLVLDNGQEFHSSSLENACLSLNIQIEYSPRKTPWHKGKIERFQGTMNRAIAHGTPGTTFSNIFQKGDYDPVKHAIVTLSNLRMIVHKWIVDVYHQKPHRGLGNVPPAVTWDSSINQQDIRVADDPRRLDVILGTSDKYTLTGSGVTPNGIVYNSPELHDMFRKFSVDGKGFKVELRIDEGDLGNIYVIVPDKSGHFLRVPALDQGYASGTSLWMHNVFKRYARDHSYPTDSTGWMEAMTEIAEIVQSSLKLKKSNAKAARYLEARKSKVADEVNTKADIPQGLLASENTPSFADTSQVSTHNRSRKTRDYDVIIENRS